MESGNTRAERNDNGWILFSKRGAVNKLDLSPAETL